MAVSSVVFTSAMAALVLSSILIYVVFYFLSIPIVRTSVPCFLEYGLQTYPTAQLDINSLDYQYLKSLQRYNLGLELVVPDSESNLQLGNFMITMELLGKKNQTLAKVSRPAHLKYQSPFLRMMKTGFYSVSLILDRALESSSISIPLIENYMESTKDQVKYIKIVLGNSKVETYESFILIETHFQGLAYFMHHWWISTALFFISNIMLAEILIASYVWNVVSASIADKVDVSEDSGEPSASAPTSDAAAPTLVTTMDEKSENSSNENATLDGDSLSELDVIEPQILNEMLRNTESASRPRSGAGILLSRTSTPSFTRPVSQNGNFSYPYSRNHRETEASVPSSSPSSPAQVVVPDIQDIEDNTVLASRTEEFSASSIHFEDSTIRDEYSEEFDLEGLLDKDDLQLL